MFDELQLGVAYFTVFKLLVSDLLFIKGFSFAYYNTDLAAFKAFDWPQLCRAVSHGFVK
jgi:hypothetical protein